MKRVIVFLSTAVFLICFVACASTQEAKDDASSQANVSPFAQTPKVVKENVVTKTATIVAIDMKTRMVTLKDKNGNVWDIKADERVKNLAQVMVGDEVLTKYYESVVVQIVNPETPTGTTTTETSTVSKPGDKPAGTETSQVTVVATIVAIDPNKTSVTLKGPEGNSVTFPVKDPKNLDNVKVGDQVSITYTQALAISVQKAEKK
jgi:Cu/Ag efflux protein CusF